MKQKGRSKVKLVIKKPITKDWETQIKEMVMEIKRRKLTK